MSAVDGGGATVDEVDLLRAAYRRQVRPWRPRTAPVGAVLDPAGPVVRMHYGTHGTVTHGDRDLRGADLSELIVTEQAAFAARGEPVGWRVHDDEPELGRRLAEAGFVPGPAQAVLVAGADTVARRTGRRPANVRTLGELPYGVVERVLDLAAGSAPHRTPFAEFEADARALADGTIVLLREAGGRVVDACWAELLDETEFLAVGGTTSRPEFFVPELASWAGSSMIRVGCDFVPVRYLLVEAGDPLRERWVAAGFHQVDAVRTYHWAPLGQAARERPVRQLFDQAEYDEIWDRFLTRFRFRPGIHSRPAIAEPPASVTWHLGTTGDACRHVDVDRLQEIVERGLRACVRPREPVYWLDWQHVGYRFDPTRVGGAGQPRWPGAVFPDGDYYLYLTGDLRLGTFGHPWEETLCVFGVQLLAAVEDELTALLGRAVRRGGRPVD